MRTSPARAMESLFRSPLAACDNSAVDAVAVRGRELQVVGIYVGGRIANVYVEQQLPKLVGTDAGRVTGEHEEAVAGEQIVARGNQRR